MIKNFLVTITFSLGLLVPAITLADVAVSFNNGATVSAGSRVILSGTITNNGSQAVNIVSTTTAAAVSLIGQSASGTPAGLAVDQTATAAFLPAVLTPGQVYQGSLLQISTASSTASGSYWGIYNLYGSTASSSTSSVASQLYYFNIAIPYSAPASTTPAATSTSGTAATTTVPAFTGGLQMPGGLSMDQILGNSGTGSGNGLTMSAYPNGPRLIKMDGGDLIYWVSGGNLKLPMFNRAVFLSYGNKDEDVQTVGQDELNFYQDAKYIRLNGKGGIYKADPGMKIKRLISSDAWSATGLGADQIVNVNRAEFNSYKTGSKITDSADLQ